MSSEGDLVRIALANGQPQAEMLKGILTEEGIPAMTKPRGILPDAYIGLGGPHDVLVRRSDEARAKQVLSELVEPPEWGDG